MDKEYTKVYNVKNKYYLGILPKPQYFTKALKIKARPPPPPLI